MLEGFEKRREKRFFAFGKIGEIYEALLVRNFLIVPPLALLYLAVRVIF